MSFIEFVATLTDVSDAGDGFTLLLEFEVLHVVRRSFHL